jgi:3-dehydroquinate synthase
MQTIEIKTETRISRILIGEKLENLLQYVPDGKKIIITDDNIFGLYGNCFPPFPVIITKQGEKHKTLDTLDFIFEKLVEFEADRSTFIVAIGGGIVCDVAGFAASVYMRGLRFGFVSTTLLSQVDASVGGKNGVNFRGFKNMLGVFNQPEFVICDIGMLKTLNDREFRSGFAEIIKAAVIKDGLLFSYLEQHYTDALRNKASVMEKLIYDAVKIKSGVVEMDEKEKGERKKLNFGHTFAHAIEHTVGILHGEAVSVGMALAGKLSVYLGLLKKNELERLTRLIKNMELPVTIDFDFSALFDAMKKDKKRDGGFIHMILIENIGSAIVKKIPLDKLEKLNYDLRQYS